MLKQLRISNFALFADVNLDFAPGYTIILGETGAGKSLIVDALMLLVKDRASADMVGNQPGNAYIKGVFEFSELPDAIAGLAVNNQIIVEREIDRSGRSTIKINHKVSTLALVRQMMERVVDIHSQHQSQYLLSPTNHLPLLDLFAEKQLSGILNKYKSEYRQLMTMIKDKEALEKIIGDHHQLTRLKEMVAEIEEVSLEEDEVESLKEEQQRLEQFYFIAEALEEVFNRLDHDDHLDQSFSHSLKALAKVSEVDPVIAEAYQQLEESYQLAGTALSSLQRFLIANRFEEGRLDEINTRLYQIERLQRKYGSTFSEINNILQDCQRQIKLAENGEYELYRLEEAITAKEAECYQLAQEVSQLRKDAGIALSKVVAAGAQDLYLADTQFEVSFSERELKESGIDDVAFLISLNKGMPPRLLSKVISGGELARIMLVLKIIFAEKFGTKTIILDEIDTGVSGRVAVAMAKMVKSLSKSVQIIAISHLPSVAAKADHFLYVEKNSDTSSTKVAVNVLDYQQKIEVLAKMLSEDGASSGARLLAKELLDEV